MKRDKKRILFIFGTRPEALKLIVLIDALKKNTEFDVEVCVTGQHKEMVKQVFDIYGLEVDYNLDLMKPNQTLEDITIGCLTGLKQIFTDSNPDLVLVHGDTTSSAASSIAAFYNGILVGHVESGLRTGDLLSPWPEEFNRKVISIVADYHFAPTQEAKQNLLNENIPEDKIFITGNTIIDTLLDMKTRIESENSFSKSMEKKFNFIDPSKKIILITGHRRENFGEPFKEIFKAITILAERDDIEIIYPLHKNPNVRKIMKDLKDITNITILDPLDYKEFVMLMDKAYLILTDSGGIQEEAPTFKTPVLVMRDTTERPEAIKYGVAKLVGHNSSTIVQETNNLLDNDEEYKKMQSEENPFGDGNASERIISILSDLEVQN